MLILALSLLLSCATHDVSDADGGAAAATAPASAEAAAAADHPPGTPGPVSDATVEIDVPPPETPAADASPEEPADVQPAPAPESAESAESADPDAPSPGGCLADSDCGADMLCEGQGCDDDHPGTCVPVSRVCTKDLRPYCGCDGSTFLSSGSCPGRRYQAAMPCPGDPAPSTPEGLR